MAEIRVPTLGESVTEATVGKWFKKPGDAVAVDEPLVELETDKVTIEVPAPAAGVLGEIAAKDGETVAVGALLGQIEEGAGAAGRKAEAAADRPARPEDRRPRHRSMPQPRQPKPREAGSRSRRGRPATCRVAPSVRKLAAESGIDPAAVAGHRQGRPRHQGRHAGGDRARRRAADAGRRSLRPPCRCARRRPADDAAREERVKMTRLRQTIARRLKEAQNTAAMLTTFNEVDMTRGDGAAQPVPRPVREEARREARLHGLLREGLRRRR